MSKQAPSTGDWQLPEVPKVQVVHAGRLGFRVRGGIAVVGLVVVYKVVVAVETFVVVVVVVESKIVVRVLVVSKVVVVVGTIDDSSISSLVTSKKSSSQNVNGNSHWIGSFEVAGKHATAEAGVPSWTGTLQ